MFVPGISEIQSLLTYLVKYRECISGLTLASGILEVIICCTALLCYFNSQNCHIEIINKFDVS